VKLPNGSPAKVVYAPILVDGEKQADIVAKQFQDAGVNVLVCTPDTWAFPQLSVISLLQQFPADTPINFTCGNSGPKPGVVMPMANGGCARPAHAPAGHPARHADRSLPSRPENLVDWCYACHLRACGRRVVAWPRLDGHGDLAAHVIPTRNVRLEIIRPT
jgi:L-fucose isomerase